MNSLLVLHSATNWLQKFTDAKEERGRPLGGYIIGDPKVCHGKPTFRGTRIMVWQVLEMGRSGLGIDHRGHHDSITEDTIAEAVKLSGETFIKHADEFVLKPTAA